MYSNIFGTSHGGERARAGALGGLCLRVSSRAIAGVLTVTGRGQRSVAMAATGNGSREVRYMEQTIGAQYAAMRACHPLSLMSWDQVFGINYTDSWLC